MGLRRGADSAELDVHDPRFPVWPASLPEGNSGYRGRRPDDFHSASKPASTPRPVSGVISARRFRVSRSAYHEVAETSRQRGKGPQNLHVTAAARCQLTRVSACARDNSCPSATSRPARTRPRSPTVLGPSTKDTIRADRGAAGARALGFPARFVCLVRSRGRNFGSTPSTGARATRDSPRRRFARRVEAIVATRKAAGPRTARTDQHQRYPDLHRHKLVTIGGTR